MKLRYSSALAITAIIAVACGTGGASPTPGATATTGASATPGVTDAPTGGPSITEVKIGVDLPLSGGEVVNGQPTLNGVLLAVKEWNDASMGHAYTVGTNVQDDAVNGVHNEQQGAANANTLVADEQVVGMVGAFNTSVSRAIIPVTNEFGLAQCSPANTGTDLTKEGSEVYRPVNPDVRNFFRVATPDDVQGPAGAQYAYNDVGGRRALVVDDTEAFGVGVADAFTTEFERLGGTTLPRVSNDFGDNQSFAAILTAAGADFDVVYFGGVQTTGGGQLRKDMGAAGLLDIPMVGPDGITDLGTAEVAGSFVALAGVENSGNVFGTIAGANALEMPQAAGFNAAYEAEYGDPPGAYSALAYACTQVLLQAIDANIGTAPDLAALREAVRASIIGQDTPWTTVLGEISFDANGDSSQKWISFYKTDPSLNNGAGGWVFDKQQNFAETE